jgi:hypothetical protein
MFTAPVVIFYLLALMGIVNIPFMSQEASDALVPVVSHKTFLFLPTNLDTDLSHSRSSFHSGSLFLSDRIRSRR